MATSRPPGLPLRHPSWSPPAIRRDSARSPRHGPLAGPPGRPPLALPAGARSAAAETARARCRSGPARGGCSGPGGPGRRACLWALVHDKWGWAIGTGGDGALSYLIAPAEFAAAVRPRPRVRGRRRGVPADHGGRDRRAVPAGQPLDDPEQRRRVLSGDARGDRRRPRSRSPIEAYIYWAGEIGRQFAEALAAKAAAGVRVKILLDAVGSSTHRRRDPRDRSRAAAASSPGTTRSSCDSLGRFNHRTHRKSLIIDGRIAFTGGAGIADHWRGDARNPGEWRDLQIRIEGPAVTPLQTGFAQNWLQTTGELISGPLYYPLAASRPGTLALQTIMSSPEIGASTVAHHVLPVDHLRAALDLHRQPVLRARTRRRCDALIEAKQPRRRRARSWCPASTTTTGSRARTASGCSAAARGRHRDPRIQPHDAPPQDDGGGRVLVHGRHDQLRQPLVRAQRREQHLRLRRRGARSCTTCSTWTGRAATRSTSTPGNGAASGSARRKCVAALFEEQILRDLETAVRATTVASSCREIFQISSFQIFRFRNTSCTSRAGRSIRRAGPASSARGTCSRDPSARSGCRRSPSRRRTSGRAAIARAG